MKKTILKQNYIYLMIAYLIAFLPRVYLCMQEYPVRMISDEIATMSGAAHFAGLNWSAVISKAGYYGSGFYGLFFWLFKITENPFIIYKCMLIGASLAQALVAIVAFVIMQRHFLIKNVKVLCMFSIACSYMVVTFPNRTYNEHILVLLTWIVVLLFLELKRCMGQRVKTRILTGVLLLVLAYGLTVHARALTLWIACAFVILLYYYLYKKWLISRLVVLFGGIISYIAGTQFVALVQKVVWAAENGETVRNGAINVSINFKILDPTTWFSALSVVLGQLNTISVFTGGFMILCFVFMTWLFFGMLRDRVKNKNLIIVEDKELYFIISVYLLSCVGMTIVAQTISWLPGVIEGVRDGFGTEIYSMKAITYIRYFGPYLGPGIMAGFVCGYKNREWFKRYFKPALIIFIVLQVFWTTAILPFIKNNGVTKEVFIALSLSKPGQKVDLMTYLPGVIITIVVFLLIIYLYKKNKTIIPVLLVCGLCMFQYIYTSVYFDQYASKKNMKKANAGYALVQKMENKVELPKKLYVYDATEKTDHQIFYLYQFMLNRYEIIPELPEKEDDQAIIFSNSAEVEKLYQMGYQCIPLDKNEFVYAMGDWTDEIQKYWKK